MLDSLPMRGGKPLPAALACLLVVAGCAQKPKAPWSEMNLSIVALAKVTFSDETTLSLKMKSGTREEAQQLAEGALTGAGFVAMPANEGPPRFSHATWGVVAVEVSKYGDTVVSLRRSAADPGAAAVAFERAGKGTDGMRADLDALFESWRPVVTRFDEGRSTFATPCPDELLRSLLPGEDGRRAPRALNVAALAAVLGGRMAGASDGRLLRPMPLPPQWTRTMTPASIEAAHPYIQAAKDVRVVAAYRPTELTLPVVIGKDVQHPEGFNGGVLKAEVVVMQLPEAKPLCGTVFEAGSGKFVSYDKGEHAAPGRGVLGQVSADFRSQCEKELSAALTRISKSLK